MIFFYIFSSEPRWCSILRILHLSAISALVHIPRYSKIFFQDASDTDLWWRSVCPTVQSRKTDIILFVLFFLQNDINIERKQSYKNETNIISSLWNRPHADHTWYLSKVKYNNICQKISSLSLPRLIQSSPAAHPGWKWHFNIKLLQLEKEDFTYYLKHSACVWHINMKCTA